MAQGKQILIADDDPVVRHLLSSVLSAAGHTVETAESGSRCIEMLREKAASNTLPDLLFLDLQLADMAGAEVLEKTYTEEEKKELHGKLGKAWETFYGKKDEEYRESVDSLENHYLEVARHYTKAHDLKKALQYLPHAGVQYKLGWSTEKAIETYEQFIEFYREYCDSGGEGFEDEKGL